MQLAQNAAAAAGVSVTGLDPASIIAIITQLISIFSGCMKPADASAARRHVVDAYHNGRYDDGTMRIATHQARLAARLAGTRIDNTEAAVIATATLDQIRTASDADLQEAIGTPAT